MKIRPRLEDWERRKLYGSSMRVSSKVNESYKKRIKKSFFLSIKNWILNKISKIK